MTWHNPIRGGSHTLDFLVEYYTAMMTPKKGRKAAKAIKEIERQRTEKLERIERLRLEAAALFVVARNLSEIPEASR